VKRGKKEVFLKSCEAIGDFEDDENDCDMAMINMTEEDYGT
jgi:hypothetical protein